MVSHSHQLSTGWIKVWITLGFFVTAIGYFLPTVLRSLAQGEVQRYQECAAGLRDNCQPSMVWVLYEQALREEGADNLLLDKTRLELDTLR